MKLKDLNGIPALAISEIGENTINGLTSDSRLVERGFLFAALKGSKSDGAAYAADAAARGATVIVTSKGAKLGKIAVPIIYVDDPRRTLALAAASFYKLQPDVMVAITGTSGQTDASVLRNLGIPTVRIGYPPVPTIPPAWQGFGGLGVSHIPNLAKVTRAIIYAIIDTCARSRTEVGLD